MENSTALKDDARIFFSGHRNNSENQVRQVLKKPAGNEKELMSLDECLNFLEGGYLPNGNVLFFAIHSVESSIF